MSATSRGRGRVQHGAGTGTRTRTGKAAPSTSQAPVPHPEDSGSESEYEECLVYIETDDLRSAEQMLRDEVTRGTKVTTSCGGSSGDEPRAIEITLHNLNSEEPIMELQGMHFTGRVEDPPGTALLFAPSSAGLLKLTSDLTPPIDPVFGVQPPPGKEYQLVYKADKIIRMKRVHMQVDPEFEDYGYIRTFEDSSGEEQVQEQEGDGEGEGDDQHQEEEGQPASAPPDNPGFPEPECVDISK